MPIQGGYYDPQLKRVIFAEEKVYKNQKIVDFKKEGYANWSNVVKIKVLKYKLKPKENSFLKTSKSNYTFIRKCSPTNYGENVVYDINLLVPMIVKNCLPTKIKLIFADSD